MEQVKISVLGFQVCFYSCSQTPKAANHPPPAFLCLEDQRAPVASGELKSNIISYSVNTVPGSQRGLVSRRRLLFREPDSQRLTMRMCLGMADRRGALALNYGLSNCAQ